MNSAAPTTAPFRFRMSAYALMAPRPQSVLTARKSARLTPSLSTYCSRPSASISEGGLMRKIHGLPRLVIEAALEVSTTIGTPYSSSFGIAASVIELPQAPMIAGTRPRTTSFSAALAASLGSDLLSSITRSIFRPLTPPRALSQSRATSAPTRTELPDAATGPERGAMTPVTRNVITLRRLLRRVTRDNVHGEIDSGGRRGREAW